MLGSIVFVSALFLSGTQGKSNQFSYEINHEWNGCIPPGLPSTTGKVNCYSDGKCDVICGTRGLIGCLANGGHTAPIPKSHYFENPYSPPALEACLAIEPPSNSMFEKNDASTIIRREVYLGKGHGIGKQDREIYALTQVLWKHKKINFLMNKNAAKILVNTAEEILKGVLTREEIQSQWEATKKSAPKGSFHYTVNDKMKVDPPKVEFRLEYGIDFQALAKAILDTSFDVERHRIRILPNSYGYPIYYRHYPLPVNK